MQTRFLALAMMLGLAGCDSGIIATDGTNLLNQAIGDVVERSEGDAIVVDGQSYLLAQVRHTYTDDNPSSRYYGDRRTVYYDEVNVRGRTVRCFRGQDCVEIVREALAQPEPPQNRVPVDDGDQM